MPNEPLQPEATEELDNLKEEVEDELNIEVGADQTARNNGKVGGQMVKRMIAFAENEMHVRKGQIPDQLGSSEQNTGSPPEANS